MMTSESSLCPPDLFRSSPAGLLWYSLGLVTAAPCVDTWSNLNPSLFAFACCHGIFEFILSVILGLGGKSDSSQHYIYYDIIFANFPLV